MKKRPNTESAKRRWITALLAMSVVVGLIGFALVHRRSELEVSVEPDYYTNKAGLLFAKIHIPPRWQLPMAVSVETSISTTIQTREGESQNGLERVGVASFGYFADCIVPATRWRLRFGHVDKSQIRLGTYTFALPPRTNIIITQELPSNTEVLLNPRKPIRAGEPND